MSKMTSWVGIMGGLLLLCYITGLLPSNSISGGLLSLVLSPGTVNTWELIAKIAAVSAVAFLISAFTFNKQAGPDFYVVQPFVTVLLSFGYDFVSIFFELNKYGGLASIIGLLFFGPIMVMFILNVMEWWRGVSP